MHTHPAVDKEGYLRELADWNEEVAEYLAQQENIKLNASHWEVINLLRNFYRRHQASPATRALINLVNESSAQKKGGAFI